MERLNLFTLQDRPTATDLENMVFLVRTVGMRWNCDAAWFNRYKTTHNLHRRWND